MTEGSISNSVGAMSSHVQARFSASADKIEVSMRVIVLFACKRSLAHGAQLCKCISLEKRY